MSGNKSSKIILFFAFAGILSLLFIIRNGSTGIYSGHTDECFACHEDKELYSTKNGKKISLFVSADLYKKSVHSSSDCSDCHENYNPDEQPHTKNKQQVDCKSCHSELKGIESSVHGSVKCSDCHSKHYVKTAKEFAAEQTASCLNCHTNKNIQGYKTSLHAKKNIGCESCHAGGHSTRRISKEESEQLCKKCHEKTHKGFDNTVHNSILKEGRKGPSCIDCHGSHEMYSTSISIESNGCLKCHLDDKKFPGESKGSAKFVKDYKTSIHGMLTSKNGKEAAGCVDCHGNHIVESKGDTKLSLTRAVLLETCGKCHPGEANDFKNSAHGKNYLGGNKSAPSCTICHGEHSIQTVLKTDRLAKINQADMCLGCHKEQKLSDRNYKGEEELVSNYGKSAHYIALQKGNDRSAACSDCHGAHTMEKASDPNSKIYKKNIEKTCGKSECHPKAAYRVYRKRS